MSSPNVARTTMPRAIRRLEERYGEDAVDRYVELDATKLPLAH